MTAVRPPTVGTIKEIVLSGLQDLGGSGTTAQIREVVERSPAITAEQRAVKHGAGPGSEVHYRTRWALVDLRRQGSIERLGPRSWALTAAGTPSRRPPS
jgi:restriction system protein